MADVVNTEIKLLINPRLCWLHRPPHPAHHQKAPAPPEKKFWECVQIMIF